MPFRTHQIESERFLTAVDKVREAVFRGLIDDERFDELIDPMTVLTALSLKRLYEYMMQGDRSRADLDVNKYRIEYETLISREELLEVARPAFIEAGLMQPDDDLVISGNGYYPINGYMGWHTNACQPGKRIYCNWASESQRSGLCFHWEGTTEGREISFDRKGWQFREFDTTPDPPFWHCVYSNCDRVSLGFRVVEGGK